MNNTNLAPLQTDCPTLVGDSLAQKIGKTAGFCILALMSFTGNSFVILVIYKNRGMRTTTNYYILSMALSDILFSAFTMPRKIVATFSHGWLVSGLPGELLCKFVPFIQDVATAVSILSMVAIAADRFYGLVYPLKKGLFTGRRRRCVVVSTWVLAVLFHCPYFYTYKLSLQGDTLFCISTWEPTFDQLKATQIYFLTLSVFLFFLPLALVTVLYSVIMMNFKRQKFPGNQSSRNKKRVAQRNKNVLKMLVTVVVMFAICWLPFNVMVYLVLFHWTSGQPCGLQMVNFCVLFLAYSNSALSPGLYFVFSQNFRRGLKHIFNPSRKWDNTSLRRTKANAPHSVRVPVCRGMGFETDV